MSNVFGEVISLVFYQQDSWLSQWLTLTLGRLSILHFILSSIWVIAI